MNIKNFVKINVSETTGPELHLIDARPVYEYVNGERTQKVIGTAYTVICVQRMYTELTMKVMDKSQQVPAPEDGEPVRVQFSGLDLFLFYRNRVLELGARADGIAVVNPKNQWPVGNVAEPSGGERFSLPKERGMLTPHPRRPDRAHARSGYMGASVTPM